MKTTMRTTNNSFGAMKTMMRVSDNSGVTAKMEMNQTIQFGITMKMRRKTSMGGRVKNRVKTRMKSKTDGTVNTMKMRRKTKMDGRAKNTMRARMKTNTMKTRMTTHQFRAVMKTRIQTNTKKAMKSRIELIRLPEVTTQKIIKKIKSARKNEGEHEQWRGSTWRLYVRRSENASVRKRTLDSVLYDSFCKRKLHSGLINSCSLVG